MEEEEEEEGGDDGGGFLDVLDVAFDAEGLIATKVPGVCGGRRHPAGAPANQQIGLAHCVHPISATKTKKIVSRRAKWGEIIL